VRHADYIASWLEVLRSDPRAIVQAAGLASRSADWLLGRLPEVVTGEAGSAVTAWTEQYGRSIRFMGMLGGASRPPDLPLQRQLTLRWLAQVERVCFLNYKDLKQILVDEPYSERVRAARRVTRLMLYLRPLARVPEAVLGSQSVGNNSWIWIINARKCRAFCAAVRLLQLQSPWRDPPELTPCTRRFMNPAFAFKYLEMQFPLYLGPVNGLIEIYKDKLKEAGDPEDGAVIELTHGVNACLLDIICSTAFGA